MRSMIAAATVLCATACSAQSVTLVDNGKPVAAIVISEEALAAKPYKPVTGMKANSVTPAQKTRLAALELQRYIEKITGAQLPLLGENTAVDGPVVLVGATKRTAALKLDIPAGVTPQRTDEGYVICTRGNALVLAGNDDGPWQGTFFAVSELLNRLGVRWFMPGEFGEYVPKTPTVIIAPVDFRDKPDFIVRAWNGNLAPELYADDALWRLHNKASLSFNDIIEIPGDSWLRKYMPGKEFIQTNPEYFAKKFDGSLDPHMVNLTHPDVPRLVAEKIKARIEKERKTNPDFNSVGFAPDDGLPIDFTKETMALNQGFADLCGREGVAAELSMSEEWFRFVNKVTEEVVKDYPGFIITTNGYTNRTFPPEGVKLHPNVGVMFAAIWSDLLHAYDDPKSWQCVIQGQMLKRWGQLSSHVFIYNYNFPMLVNALTPLPMTRKIARNTPLIKQWGIIGFEDEQTFSWMAHGITTFYLRARLYWRANDDAKAILADYFDKWYGPAARSSQAYWGAIEAAIENTPLLMHEDRAMPWVYTDEMIAAMEKSQRESEAVAVDEPYKTRVRIDRLILDHLKGYQAMNRAEYVGDFAEAIKQADFMFQQREELNKISPYLHIPESKDPRRKYFAGSHYWNLTQRRERYQKYLDMTTGKTGDMIVQAPREVKFTLDAADLGRIGRWYDPGFDRAGWRKIDTAAPFYIQGDGMLDKQGVPYVGFMWYVFELDVPQAAIGKPIRLYAPTVATEAWVWTNGEYTGHRPYVEAYIRPGMFIDFDVTSQIKAGRNVIGVRVSTSSSRISVSEGFCGPLWLYTPKAEATEKK